MTGLTTYYQRWREGLTIAPPEGMVRSIIDFLKLADKALKENNFLEFYQKNREDFLGFAHFVHDHQGFYDKARFYYNWQTLHPVVEAVFKHKLDIPYKSRLLELTGKYALAVYDVDDDDVVNFITSHLTLYAGLKDKLEDEHGRAQTILEAVYAKLQAIKKNKPFEVYSPKWALETLIIKGFYNL